MVEFLKYCAFVCSVKMSGVMIVYHLVEVVFDSLNFYFSINSAAWC